MQQFLLEDIYITDYVYCQHKNYNNNVNCLGYRGVIRSWTKGMGLSTTMIYFPAREYLQVKGALGHKGTQNNFNAMLSLCRMLDPVAACPEWIWVVQEQVASKAAESLLTAPLGNEGETGSACGICPFPTRMRPIHCSGVQGPGSSSTLCLAQ